MCRFLVFIEIAADKEEAEVVLPILQSLLRPAGPVTMTRVEGEALALSHPPHIDNRSRPPASSLSDRSNFRNDLLGKAAFGEP